MKIYVKSTALAVGGAGAERAPRQPGRRAAPRRWRPHLPLLPQPPLARFLERLAALPLGRRAGRGRPVPAQPGGGLPEQPGALRRRTEQELPRVARLPRVQALD